jgi:hypothetical protein
MTRVPVTSRHQAGVGPLDPDLRVLLPGSDEFTSWRTSLSGVGATLFGCHPVASAGLR